MYLFILFIYKLRTQCHTIIAETVQNSNRHWHRPTQVLKHLRVACALIKENTTNQHVISYWCLRATVAT